MLLRANTYPAVTCGFVVNLTAVQALGITFPNEIMLQVTEVIQ